MGRPCQELVVWDTENQKLVGVITRESLVPKKCGITTCIWRSIPRDYIVWGETLPVLLIEA